MGLIKNIFGSGKKEEGIQICAPVAGRLVPISEVSDPTFADGILGQGAAIMPDDNRFSHRRMVQLPRFFPPGMRR